MKKNLFMVAAVALMALVSCNKEEINNGVQEPASDIVFVAEFEQEADTKIALGEKVDGVRKTTWVAGDQIKINGTVFSAQADGASTEFKTTEAFDETAATFRAVYPSSSWQSATSATIPATQDGTFASASIAVAESSTKALKFQNLVTILKFQVPESCSTVTFESTASIAGRITVNYSDGNMTPDYVHVTNGSSKITLSGSFIPETDYYVAVKPGTHKFTVSIDGEISKASTKAVTVERSKILNMGVLPVPVPPTTIYLVPGVWASDNAWFAAHFFGDGVQEDKKMDDSDGDGIYEVTVPYGATGVNFCRMNPKFTEFAWNQDGEEEHVWNQTENLTVPASDATEVYYVVTDWTAGAWKTYDDATTKPIIYEWSIVGTLNSWNTSATPFELDGDYYVATNVNFEEDGEFKLVNNGTTWYNADGSFVTNKWVGIVANDGANISIAAGTYDFYLSGANLQVVAAGSEKPLDPSAILPEDGWVYLKPNSNWTQANARFAIYFFGKGEEWVSMTKVEGTPYYGVKISDIVSKGYTGMIFCRMNPNASANNWNNKWNQSGDLNVSDFTDNNLFSVPSGSWDGATSTWSNVARLN